MIFMKRSQISWEFLILISVALVMFAIFGGIIANYTIYYHSQKLREDANSLLLYVNKQLETDFQVHDGFYTNLNLPKLIDGNNYTIVHNDSSISLVIADKNIKLSAKAVTFVGNFNNFDKLNNTVFKSFGVLHLN